MTSALLAASFLYRPAGPPWCASKRLGFSCPGCGLMRSVTAFAQGRVAESVEMHLFGPVVFAVLATLWAVAAWGLVKRREFRTPNTPAFTSALAGTLVLLLGYWAARVATHTVP